MTQSLATRAVRAGITPGLLRLSVGIESLNDLAADVRTGLARAARIAEQCQ